MDQFRGTVYAHDVTVIFMDGTTKEFTCHKVPNVEQVTNITSFTATANAQWMPDTSGMVAGVGVLQLWEIEEFGGCVRIPVSNIRMWWHRFRSPTKHESDIVKGLYSIRRIGAPIWTDDNKEV